MPIATANVRNTARTITAVTTRAYRRASGQGARDELADGLRLDQEPVVADDRVDHGDVAGGRDQLGELVMESKGVGPIPRDAGQGDLSGDPRERGLDSTPAAPDVVVVHRLAQHAVGVGVESARKLVAVIPEVRLHRVPAAFERSLVALMFATEACIELELGAVRDLPDAARDRHPEVGPVPG